jgi:hypothetical protein
MPEPIVLFGVQFTVALVAYALLARWYAWPRLSRLPVAMALIPLLWIHVFRIVGGSILAPASVGPGVPTEFRTMVGYGDMLTGVIALIAVIALYKGARAGIALAWICVTVGMVDTVNAIIQSMRFNVFDYPLGVNWVIVTAYVPALLVSSFMIFVLLLSKRPAEAGTSPPSS